MKNPPCSGPNSRKRRLIVNADDFGFTRGVNRAVERCFTRGTVRSASLMAGGSAFEDAARLARSLPGLGVGAHLVLTGLRAVSEPGSLPGLADSRGFLPPSPGALIERLLRFPDARASVFRELNAQLSRIVDAGIRPTHLDSHKHVHILPPVLRSVTDLARKYSVRWIRNPFEVENAGSLLRGVAPSHRKAFWKQHVKSLVARVFRPGFMGHVGTTGLRLPDRFHGVSLTGLWNEDAALHTVKRLSPGLNEWMFHPGVADEELHRTGTRLTTQREVEMNLLCSSRLKEALEQAGMELTHFGEVKD